MIDETLPRNDYTGNGTTNQYDYDFKIWSESDLLVKVRNADDVETTLVLDTDYTVDGLDDDDGGTITLVDNDQSWLDANGFLDDDIHLSIVSNIPYEQDTDLSNQDDFYPEVYERTFDKQTRMLQQTRTTLDRCLKVQETDYTDDLELPTAEDRANKFLAFDADGDPIASSASIDPDDITVSAFAETLLDDANAAAARETLGFTGTGGTAQTAIIEDSAVTAVKISNGAVTVNKIGSGAVTADKLASNSVETAKILDANVTKAKLSDTATYLDVVNEPTSPYTVVAAADFIEVDSSSAEQTINLPALSSHLGRSITIVKTDAGLTNAVVIAPDGSDQIDGVNELNLRISGEKVTLVGGTDFWLSTRYVPSRWVSYTPTGTWSTNTTYTGFWRRKGDSLDLHLAVAVTGAPDTAALTVNLPGGLTIDTNKIAVATANITPFMSHGIIKDAGTNDFSAMVRYSSTTAIAIHKDDGDGTYSAVTQAAPMTWASGDYLILYAFGIPIVGWEG